MSIMYLLQQGTGPGTMLTFVGKKTLLWDSFAPRLNNNHSPVVSRAWIFFLLNKLGVSLMIEGSFVADNIRGGVETSVNLLFARYAL